MIMIGQNVITRSVSYNELQNINSCIIKNLQNKIQELRYTQKAKNRITTSKRKCSS